MYKQVEAYRGGESVEVLHRDDSLFEHEWYTKIRLPVTESDHPSPEVMSDSTPIEIIDDNALCVNGAVVTLNKSQVYILNALLEMQGSWATSGQLRTIGQEKAEAGSLPAHIFRNNFKLVTKYINSAAGCEVIAGSTPSPSRYYAINATARFVDARQPAPTISEQEAEPKLKGEYSSLAKKPVIQMVRQFKHDPAVRLRVAKVVNDDKLSGTTNLGSSLYGLTDGYPSLSPWDEVELAHTIAAGTEAFVRWQDGGDHFDAADDQTREAIREGVVAFETFANCNLRLVMYFARQYNQPNSLHGFDEMVQNGIPGLQRAIADFDPTRGIKFSTFAERPIKQAISRGIARQSRTIAIPVEIHEAWMKIGREEVKLTRELGREPSAEEIAQQTGMPIEKILLYSRAGSLTLPSYEVMVEERQEDSWNGSLRESSIVAAESAQGPDAAEYIMQAPLSDVERVIVCLRYGIAIPAPQALAETPRFAPDTYRRFIAEVRQDGQLTADRDITELLGITRPHLHDLEQSALYKLRSSATALNEPDASVA